MQPNSAAKPCMLLVCGWSHVLLGGLLKWDSNFWGDTLKWLIWRSWLDVACLFSNQKYTSYTTFVSICGARMNEMFMRLMCWPQAASQVKILLEGHQGWPEGSHRVPLFWIGSLIDIYKVPITISYVWGIWSGQGCENQFKIVLKLKMFYRTNIQVSTPIISQGSISFEDHVQLDEETSAANFLKILMGPSKPSNSKTPGFHLKHRVSNRTLQF